MKTLHANNNKVLDELIKKSQEDQQKIAIQLSQLKEERQKVSQELKRAQDLTREMQLIIASEQEHMKKVAPQPNIAAANTLAAQSDNDYANLIFDGSMPPPPPPKKAGPPRPPKMAGLLSITKDILHTSALLPSQDVAETEKTKLEATLRAKIQAEQAEQVIISERQAAEDERVESVMAKLEATLRAKIQAEQDEKARTTEIKRQAAEEERVKIAEKKLAEIAEKAKRAKISRDKKQAEDSAKQIAKRLQSAEQTANDALAAMRAMQAENALKQTLSQNTLMTPPTAVIPYTLLASQSPYPAVSAFVEAETVQEPTASMATKKSNASRKPRGSRGGAGSRDSRSQSNNRY